MNQSEIRGRLKNRLARLNKKIKDAPGDRQGNMTDRVKEIEALLKKK
jgi:hypothetical protein